MQPPLPQVLRRNLARALEDRHLEDAAELLARLEAVDPLSLGTRGSRLEYLVRAGRTDEADRLAQSLATLFPTSAHVLHWAGRAAYRVGDYARAEAWLRESRTLAPRWLTDRWLGKTLTQVKQLDEAEALLAPLMAMHPECGLDLAWVYQRRGELDRALACVDAYRVRFPGDPRAERDRLRLVALTTQPEELLSEVDTLRDLGEDVPEAMFGEYFETLLRAGQGTKARALFAEKGPGLAPETRLSIGWAAYRGQAWDLAFDLLLEHVPRKARNPKHLNSLERCARMCAREAELAEAYRRHAPQAPNLWGRAQSLGQT